MANVRAVLYDLGVILAHFFCFLGQYWAHFGAILTHFKAVLGHLGTSWRLLGRILDHPFSGRRIEPFQGGPAQSSATTWGLILGPKIGSKLTLFFMLLGSIFVTFGPLLKPFRGSIFEPDGPKTGQDGFQRAIKSFRVPKTCICKTLRNHFFSSFWGLSQSKTASEDPRKFPKDTPGATNP